MKYKLNFHPALWFAAGGLCLARLAGANPPAPQQSSATAESGTSPIPATPLEAAIQDDDRDLLQDIVKLGSPSDQASAFIALQALDPELAVQSLIADYHNLELGTRLQSLELIDRSVTIDPQIVTSLLREALHDSNPLLGDYALEALTRRAGSQSELLSTTDLSAVESERQQLAKVHFAAMDENVFGVRELMRNGDAAVQATAFDAAAAFDATAAVKELVAELHDQTSPYRLQTLDRLVQSLYVDAGTLLLLLEQASKDDDPLVKSYARAALIQKQREEAPQAYVPNIAPR